MDIVDHLHGAAIRSAFAIWYGQKPLGRYLAELEQTQWWPWEDIQSLQMRKLESLLQHAHKKVPFYRRRFAEADLLTENIQGPDDLARLPILTKRDIQNHRHEMLAEGTDQRSLIENHTGGSTGHPLTFYQDQNYRAWKDADLLRNYRMAGYKLGMRWAFLWGSDYDAHQHNGWLGYLKDRFIYNLLWINTFDLSVPTLTKQAEQLVRFKPQILVAYVSSATLLARLVKEQEFEDIRPQAIQTSAEILTTDDRELLEATFNCPVFNRYGCREVSNIAHECEAHNGLHILAENNLVEIIKENGQPGKPGEEGHIVVTNLNNFAMPFIRYDTEDIGVYSDQACSCGRGLPLLAAVKGRTADVFTSPSGKLLHGEFFTHLFYKTSGVYQFQVLQETLENLVVRIVSTTNFNRDSTLSFLEEAIHRHGDPAFRVRFELCEQIPPSPSGKYKFTSSKVPLKLPVKD
jgi:phenylacetate-CoA ligase